MNAYTPWKFCPWCGHPIDGEGGHSDRGCLSVEQKLVDCTDPDCKPEHLLLAPGGIHAHYRPFGCACKAARSVLTGELSGRNHR